MVTAKVALDLYCKENNLPQPSGKDYKNAGRIIVTHFRRYWAKDKPMDVINSVRFTLENGFIVLEYPDVFLPEMFNRIEYFFKIKSERFDKVPVPKNSQPVKKERKRIPLKQKPAYRINNRGDQQY